MLASSHQYVAIRQIQIRECGVLRRLCRFRRLDGSGVGLNKSLLASADARGIGVVRLRLFDACFGPLKIGFGLLDGRLGPGELCALLAVVEAGKNSTLGDAITDIRSEFDEHARDLESDLRRDLRLDGAEAENLNRHIALNLRDLYVHRTEEQGPGAQPDATHHCETARATRRFSGHALPSSAGEALILCASDTGGTTFADVPGVSSTGIPFNRDDVTRKCGPIWSPSY